MPAEDMLLEAQHIVSDAETRSVTLRLLGGLAVRSLCPSSTNPVLVRDYKDMDFIGLKKQSRQIKRLFIEQGYTPDEMFNALHGSSRLVFFDKNQRRIDIFLDVFEMCHKFDFRHRLGNHQLTLPVTDILATKLQVFQTNEKDFKDIITILVDHDVGNHDDGGAIDGLHLASLCAADWGTYKTFTRTLQNTLQTLDQFELEPTSKEIVKGRIAKLLSILESKPKSLNWKARAVIGEKSQWYKLPDDTA